MKPKLTKAYRKLFDELSNKDKYNTYSVYDFYVNIKKADKKKRNVIIRIDVDEGFHLCLPLAKELKDRGINASFYFLTHPERYYNIWNSDIPKKIYNMGFEVGIHTDHYYEQLIYGIDGLDKLKKDILELKKLINGDVKGMVYHGHPAMINLGTVNWELTKNIESHELGLEYHDGLKSCYIEPNSLKWKPKCDDRISDYMGFPYSWGWNYYPSYPKNRLLAQEKGKVFHIAFHTKSCFRWWKHWTFKYGEKMIPKDTLLDFWKKRIIIITNYNLNIKKIKNYIKRLIFLAKS